MRKGKEWGHSTFCTHSFVVWSSISDVRITRQGFEKRVVSQDLQLWLSNVSVSSCIVVKHLFWYAMSDFSAKSDSSLVTGPICWRTVHSSCSSWTTSTLSSLPTLSIYLTPTYINLCLWYRCKKYNWQLYLIKTVLRKHCREYWNVSREFLYSNPESKHKE